VQTPGHNGQLSLIPFLRAWIGSFPRDCSAAISLTVPTVIRAAATQILMTFDNREAIWPIHPT